MINKIGIHIKVSDFKKSYKFYTSLGFKTVFEYGPEKVVNEDYNGAVFEQGGTKLEIADGHRAVRKEVFREKISSSKISLIINVSNLEDIVKLCNKNSIEISVNPRHYYWGTLELVIKDPDGVVLVFIEPYTKESAEKLNANETFGIKTS